MLTYQCISIGMTSSIGDVSILVIEKLNCVRHICMGGIKEMMW